MNKTDIITIVKEISSSVTAYAAAAVDKDGRFPVETFSALKQHKILSLPIDSLLGGEGADLTLQAEVCSILAAQCGSSGLILAMHFAQIECIKRNTADSHYFRTILKQVVNNQWLLSSIASEVGTFGNSRISRCAITQNETGIFLKKQATTASYAEYADAFLVTARKHEDADESDQVLVLFLKEDVKLKRSDTWDTLGMRGTVSPGYLVEAYAGREQIFSDSYSIISAHTVIPFAHVLWAAVWEGIAKDAVRKVNRCAKKRLAARGALKNFDDRVGAINTKYRNLRAMCHYYSMRVDNATSIPRVLSDKGYFDWAMEYNALKVNASRLAHDIIHESLQFLGVQGYKNNSELSLARNYRDICSSTLMVPNHGLEQINAQLSASFGI